MVFLSLRKVLIIPKGQPDTVDQMIDDTMVKTDKMPNNDIQNTTQKTKDLVPRTPLKHGLNSDLEKCQCT